MAQAKLRAVPLGGMRSNRGTKPAESIWALARGTWTAALWALPILTRLQTHALGVLGDPDEYTWFLGWFRYAVANHLNPLLSDFLNHPAGINLMWNTSNPLVAILNDSPAHREGSGTSGATRRSSCSC